MLLLQIAWGRAMWGWEASDARASGVIYWALHLLPAGLLFSALDPWPEAFYAATRTVVCAAAVGVAFLIYRRDHRASYWLVAFGMTAIISNPFVPLIVRGQVWIAYVSLAALFLTHLAATRTPEGN
jgi:hypothetical protein